MVMVVLSLLISCYGLATHPHAVVNEMCMMTSNLASLVGLPKPLGKVQIDDL